MTGINMMNYSILQSELDQEGTCLEDMHMFFVAFNQRQNKIVQGLERAEMVHMANDRGNVVTEEAKPGDAPMNVVWLKEEVDLE